MRVGNTDYLYSSSFLSVEVDTSIIVNKILEDKELQKLLYYNTKDCLSQRDLNQEQRYSLIGDQVRLVPKIDFNDEVKTHIIISFENFTNNATNPEFRDNMITVDVLTHFDIWDLGDFRLRPYRVAARIDSRLNKQKLSGIGRVEFAGANPINISENLGGLSLSYYVIHEDNYKQEVE